MTFEELKDMVNSTITENGQRQITGKALNLALLEMITAMEENKPEESAASEIFYLPDMATSEMDPADQVHNLEVYNKFKTAFEGGEPLPLLSADSSPMFASVEEQLGQPVNASGYFPCMMVVFAPADSPLANEMGEGIVFVVDMMGSTLQGVVQPDGNVMLMS